MSARNQVDISGMLEIPWIGVAMMRAFPVAQATRFTLRESVADQVRSAIGDGSLAAGVHLAEVELSENLGVSRATLREALRQLQQEGLLAQDTRGRLTVRRVTMEEVDDIFEVRQTLEALAVSRLCAKADRADDVAVLRRKLDRLKVEMGLADDLDADLDFHGTICQLAGNEILYSAWRSISGLIRITMITAGADPARENSTYERHAPIVDYIESGDEERARAYLRDHMTSAAANLLTRMGDVSPE
jgi:DNA-binding GntR family transcriptional regulator